MAIPELAQPLAFPVCPGASRIERLNLPEGPDGLPPHCVIATWRAMDAHRDSESMDLVGGSVISILQNQLNRPRLLIIEPDSAARRQLARVFERP